MELTIELSGDAQGVATVEIPEILHGGTISIPVVINRSPTSDILTDRYVVLNDIGGIKTGSNIGGLNCKSILRELLSPAGVSNFHILGGSVNKLVLPIGQNLPETVSFVFNSDIDDYNKNLPVNLYMNGQLMSSGKLSDLSIICESCGVIGDPHMVNERVVFKLELINTIGGVTHLEYTVRWGGEVSYFIAPGNVDLDSDVFKYYVNGTQRVLNDLNIDIDTVECVNSTDRLYIVMPIEYGVKTRFIGMTALTANLVNFTKVREGLFLKNGAWIDAIVYMSGNMVTYTKLRVKS